MELPGNVKQLPVEELGLQQERTQLGFLQRLQASELPKTLYTPLQTEQGRIFEGGFGQYHPKASDTRRFG